MPSLFRTAFVLSLACTPVLHASFAADGDAPAADSQPAPFTPGEISIGEPIQLPTRRSPEPAPGGGPTAASPRQATPAPPATAGNGWIGLTVDETLVTGRLVVVDVAPGGPAERAGIRLHDHLLALDGMPLRTADQLAAALAAIAPGSTVKAAVGRGERIEEISLQAAARPTRPPAREWQSAEPATPPVARQAPSFAPKPSPSPAPLAAAPAPAPFEPPAAIPGPAPVATAPRTDVAAAKGRTALGVRTLPVDPAIQARFNLPEPAGALVIGVVHDLPASKAGVPPGSVIVALDNQPVRSPSELTRLVTSGPVGRPMTLQYILPGGEQRKADVSLQSLEVPLERALVGPEE
ncbi:MAG: PDZ domain-containing protein [Planctomycetia bacterium]